LGRTATGAVSRLENGWVFGPWGFDSLSFRFVEAWPSWQGSALLARRRCEPFAGSSPAASALRSGVVESVRRATVTRERQVRALPPEPHAPVVEKGDDAGPSTRKLRVRVPPGVLVRLLAVGELATPPASGAGDRRFDSCQPDLRGRGAAVLASLVSSRPWVRIPPAPSRIGPWTGGPRK
jgi:hypothetical protein